MNIFLNVSHKQIYSMEDVAKYLFEEGGGRPKNCSSDRGGPRKNWASDRGVAKIRDSKFPIPPHAVNNDNPLN